MGLEELFIQAAKMTLRVCGFSKKCELPSLNVHLLKNWIQTGQLTKPTTNHGGLATSRQAILALQAANNLKSHPGRASQDKPVTRLLRFPLDCIAVAGSRVTAAINCGFPFCLFSISVLYWALLLWFPLCRNKPGQKH